MALVEIMPCDYKGDRDKLSLWYLRFRKLWLLTTIICGSSLRYWVEDRPVRVSDRPSSLIL